MADLEHPDEGDEHIAFSRNPYGKSDDYIGFRCPFKVRQRVRELAASLGMHESEFMLDLTMARLDGVGHLASLNEARLRVVSGMPPERLTNGPQESNT